MKRLFHQKTSRAALAQLKSIDKECGGLRKEFIRLNGHYLKDAGESFNEWTYRGKDQGADQSAGKH